MTAMPRPEARRPFCGNCGALPQFSWLGGAHHCVVAEPEQDLDERPLHPQSPVVEPQVRVAPSPAFDSAAGLVDYVEHLNGTAIPLHRAVIEFAGSGTGHQVEVAMQWNTGCATAVSSYVNTLPTEDGGGHRDGFVSALTTVVTAFARAQGRITPDGPDLSGADVAAGLTAVVSLKIVEPRFTDRTGRRLRNADVAGFVAQTCRANLTDWFDTHPVVTKAIVNKAISAYVIRTDPRRSPRVPLR